MITLSSLATVVGSRVGDPVGFDSGKSLGALLPPLVGLSVGTAREVALGVLFDVPVLGVSVGR